MRGAEYMGSSSSASLSFAVRARSVLTMRRNNQVVSMENTHERELRELELFQAHVADRLHSLGKEEEDHRHPLISLSFLHKLLDAFVCIEEEFKSLLLLLVGRDPAIVARPPVDRLVSDFIDRAVKSLDVCNAVTEALDWLQFCQNHAEIAASALHPRSAASPFVGEAQFCRARRALSKILSLLLTPDSSRTTERAWSFGRSSRGGGAGNGGSGSGSSGGSRWLSLNWPAAKQMQTMWANLAPPRGTDATAVSAAVYTMSAIMVFVMWTLVLAFPCGERGGHGSSTVAAAAASFLPPPRQLPWAAPMVALQERIAEEWRDRKGSTGAPALLAELQSMVRCGRVLVDLGGGAPAFPLDEWQREEVAGVCLELASTCRSIEEELASLQLRVREVFHRVVQSRAEILDWIASARAIGPSSLTCKDG